MEKTFWFHEDAGVELVIDKVVKRFLPHLPQFEYEDLRNEAFVVLATKAPTPIPLNQVEALLRSHFNFLVKKEKSRTFAEKMFEAFYGNRS